ncbi:MAG: hypothetical protein EA364_09090 [Balneolaceae bacterium]|nr:MAG: hypothetical protein EA364_09090 [Balneolaceae bacterium]
MKVIMTNKSDYSGKKITSGIRELLHQMIKAYRYSNELFDSQIRAVINGSIHDLEEGTNRQLEQQELLIQLDNRLKEYMDELRGNLSENPGQLRKLLEESNEPELVEISNQLASIVQEALMKRDQLTSLLEFARSHTNELIRNIYGVVGPETGNYNQKGQNKSTTANPMAINKKI